jgi:hypothetical protein
MPMHVVGALLLLLATSAGVGSCSYAKRYMVVNRSDGAAIVEYRIRPDSAADSCPRCQLGYVVQKTRWITLDENGSPRWLPCDSTAYTMTRSEREMVVQFSLPAQRVVEIYEHTSLDDYRGTPFRLISVQVQSGAHNSRLLAVSSIPCFGNTQSSATC